MQEIIVLSAKNREPIQVKSFTSAYRQLSLYANRFNLTFDVAFLRVDNVLWVMHRYNKKLSSDVNVRGRWFTKKKADMDDIIQEFGFSSNCVEIWEGFLTLPLDIVL